MGSIHVNRNRQSLGQFTDQEVADGLQSGRFRPDDLGWHEPMDSWQPLSTFGDLPPASGVPFPAPPVDSGSAAPVWESASPPPFFSALVETVKQVLLKPAETFQAMPVEGGFGKPLKFYVVVSWASGAVGLLYQAIATLINPAFFASEEFKDFPRYVLVLVFAGIIVFMPVFLFLRSFLAAGILHLALMVVGGARKPFEATFRVLCYSSGSTSTLQLVPICGPWFFLVGSLVYSVVGLKEAHRTELWRPILAVFLIFCVCCGAVFGLLGTAAWLGYSAVHMAK